MHGKTLDDPAHWLRESDQRALATGWPGGATSGDFDRDGNRDIFIANGRLSGDTARDYDSRFWCHDIYFAPDGKPVDAVTQYFARMQPLFGKVFSWHGFESNSLLMRGSDDRLLDVGYLMGDGDPLRDARCAVSADLDQDGRMDLIYEEVLPLKRESILRVFKNTSNDAHHWIGVHLDSLGTAAGARVSVLLPDDLQMTHPVVIGGGVGVQQTGSIHFARFERKGDGD